MKYAVIFRCLCINGIYYYQALDKVIGESDVDSKISVVSDGNFKESMISPVDFKEEYGYIEISEEEYNEINLDNYLFLKYENNELSEIKDFNEESNVILAFHKKYNDFPIIPDFDIEDNILDIKEDLKHQLIGQDDVINKILSKIYNNQMLLETELSSKDIRNHKSNILLIGPYGTGKSTIKESIKDNLSPIPVVEYTLTGDYKHDIMEIVNSLLFQSNGNRYLAERGMVILDGINHFSLGDDSINLDSLKEVLDSKIIYAKNDKGEIISFDCSCLTHMVIVDSEYDYEEDPVYNDTFYSKIDGNKLLQLGFNINVLTDLFDNEVIYMNTITKDLAYDILKEKTISPLYKIKEMLENHGKIVKISNNFVDSLIVYGLDLNEGMTGIIKTLKYLMERKDLTEEEIIFKEDDLKDLMISAAIPDLKFEVDDYQDNHKEKNQYDKLKIDLEKRTINSLSVMDTVSMIKEKIKGQDEQIFDVVNAFYNHIFNSQKDFTKEELRELKENVLLIGPTGVGKTAILMNLASIFELPFVRAIATRYSKAGYVGEDVDSILVDLLNASKNDIEKAEHGILYLDEIDKIKANPDTSGVDMSSAVQDNLLTLIEGDVRTIGKEGVPFDTSNLFVIATGAFAGLEDITKARIKKEKGLTKVGFRTESHEKINLNPTTEDLYEYGFDRQFLGRFPNKIRLTSLNPDVLYEIINNQKAGIVGLKVRDYQKSGIKISMSEGFKRSLADIAYKKQAGARGISEAFLDIKKTIDKNIVDGDVEEVILNDECASDPSKITYVKKLKK